MNITAALSVISAALLISAPASAQYYSEHQLAKIEAVYVFVSDSVKDGCLPQPDALKVEAELILRRSGIKVVDADGVSQHKLEIGANGYAASSSGHSCVGNLQIELWRFEPLADGTAGLVLAGASSAVLSGSKNGSQQNFRETVNSIITGFANEILKMRG